MGECVSTNVWMRDRKIVALDVAQLVVCNFRLLSVGAQRTRRHRYSGAYSGMATV